MIPKIQVRCEEVGAAEFAGSLRVAVGPSLSLAAMQNSGLALAADHVDPGAMITARSRG